MSNLNTVYYEAVEPVDEMEYEEPVEDNDPKEDDDQSDEQPCDNDDCFSDDSTVYIVFLLLKNMVFVGYAINYDLTRKSF